MSYQNISYALVQADLDAVKTAIATINSKLPFLITLSPDERKGLMKLGPKSIDFVQDASLTVASFPNVVPASFDKAEYSKDTTLFKSLNEIKVLLDSLTEKVDDTYVAIGGEAMTASLEVYAFVQTSVDRTPGLKSMADKLKDRFRANGPRKKGPTNTNPN